ncbi:MAG: phosphotransferase [Chromatiales bacterium]|nr:phosphotransferase [Chromatiales bacterium]
MASEPLTGGVSAEVLAVTVRLPAGPMEHLVIRRHRNIDGKADRRDRAAREHALLTQLHAAGAPVPKSRLFVAPDTLIQERIEGSTALPADAAPMMAQALATIHAADTSGLPPLPVCDDPGPDLRTWFPNWDDLAAALDGIEPYPGEPVLLHGDFWPGNLLWHEGRLAAVLDWEDAAIGDPLADVACARVELACAAGDEMAEAFSRAYFELTQADDTRLPAWELYVSTAALQYMDGWGLAPDALAARKATTRARQADALAVLGLEARPSSEP